MMCTVKVGELWRVKGLFEWEKKTVIRVADVLMSGCIDANYELDESKPADLRILPPSCLLERVEN